MNRQRALDIAQNAIDLMARKNADYGSANITSTGAYGIGVRLLDKVHRILNLTQGGKTANFESVEDTFVDIMNYGIIGKMLSEGSWSDVGQPLSEAEIHAIPITGKLPMVYLAGAMDGAGFWRKQASLMLAECGISTFNPQTAFNVVIDKRYPLIAQGSIVRAINRAAILNSGGVLVNLLSSARPFGTYREIEFAVASGKPVVVVGDVSKHLDAFDIWSFPTLAQAADKMGKLLA